MRYLLLIVALLGGLYFWNMEPSVSENASVPFQIEVVKEDFVPAAPKVSVPQKQTEEVLETASEDPETVDEDAFVAQLLERFRFIAELPGAHDLAWDIRDALIDNPGAFDMSAITEGSENLLKADYLDHMIPDPNLRAKWVALMDIVLNSRPSE
ncbi:MAG: hypothetical protein H6617_11045 [Bdellovibrionaceae bacterium]|nr:hypothetical protein [Bdellovibrionales bacterium]MCB9255208.1 hypothetical protein [Pseudobdellovibrionaceae bacterium]